MIQTVTPALPCPKCGYEGPQVVEAVFSSFERQLVRCSKCSLTYTNEPLPPSPETGIEYLDKVHAYVGDSWAMGLSDRFEAYTFRGEAVKEYAWAVPTPLAIEAIVEHSPIIEIGAGGGYWAMLLRERGANVLAVDKEPGSNNWVKRDWGGVELGKAIRAKKHPNRALMLCWPPYDDSMAFNALEVYGGNTVIYIGEGEGGCCATDEFFTALERDYLTVREIAIPQWPGIHDYLTIWRRRGLVSTCGRCGHAAEMHDPPPADDPTAFGPCAECDCEEYVPRKEGE